MTGGVTPQQRPFLGHGCYEANWRHAYLVDAVTRNLCTRIGCTTCGALDFRRGVLTALASVMGQPAEKRFDEQRALEIAHALGHRGRDAIKHSLMGLDDRARRLGPRERRRVLVPGSEVRREVVLEGAC